MSVYKHPSRPGCWMIKISHGRKAPAEYIPWPGDYDSAKRYEQELRGQVNHTDPGFSEHLLEFRMAYANRSAAKTVESMEISFRHLQEVFGLYRLRQITPTLVEQYKAKRLAAGVKKRTVNIELSALSAYIKWINGRYGSKFHLPQLFTRRETKAALPQVLTSTEVMALLDHLNGDIRTIVELMAWCGLRRNETLNLTAKDLDLPGGVVRIIGKGGKWRLVPICLEATKKQLAELVTERPTGPLFPSPHNPTESRKDIRKPLQTAAKKAGISKRVHPHLFRHSFGAALVNSGADIRVIQELFGHAELTTTQLYTQVAGHAKREAVERLVAKVAMDNPL